MAKTPPPDECANCGADIPRNAHACPACGADERTGWREASIYDGLDLPEDAPQSRSMRRSARGGLAWYWIVTIVLVLLALILGSLGLMP